MVCAPTAEGKKVCMAQKTGNQEYSSQKKLKDQIQMDGLTVRPCVYFRESDKT